MDHQPRDVLRSTLKTLHHLTVSYRFETAIEALEEGVRINRSGFCDAAILAARISEYGLDTPAEGGQDLAVYDRLIEEGQAI
jgi:hypothetical protein